MTRAHHRYLLEQFIGGIIVNFGINAVIAWAVFRSLAPVPFYGMMSVYGDILGMAFILPFCVCLFVTLDARRKMRAGRFSGIDREEWGRGYLAKLPEHLGWRSAFWGAVFGVFCAPLLLWMNLGAGVSEMALWDFVYFKGGVAALMSAMLTFPVVLRAFGDGVLQPADHV